MAVDFGFWRNNTEDNSRVFSKNITGTNATNNGSAANESERVFDSKDIEYNYHHVEYVIGIDPDDEYDTPESVIAKFYANDPEMAEALRYEFTEFDEVTEADLMVKLDGFILTIFTHPNLDSWQIKKRALES